MLYRVIAEPRLRPSRWAMKRRPPQRDWGPRQVPGDDAAVARPRGPGNHRGQIRARVSLKVGRPVLTGVGSPWWTRRCYDDVGGLGLAVTGVEDQVGSTAFRQP